MAYSNRKYVSQLDVAYPELQPVTAVRRKAVQSQQTKPASRAETLLYLLINAALVFGLAQCARTIISDGMNLSKLLSSQASVQQYHAETRNEHQLLSEKIKVYSSASGIEELARNYLNMVGQNELPVRFQ